MSNQMTALHELFIVFAGLESCLKILRLFFSFDVNDSWQLLRTFKPLGFVDSALEEAWNNVRLLSKSTSKFVIYFK